MKRKTMKGKIVKKVIVLLCLATITLSGCETNIKSNKLNPTPTPVQEETVNEDNKVIEKPAATAELEEKVVELVTGDNLTIAVEFAKDILNEDFDKLLHAYPYDDKMKAAMEEENTKKTILFYNTGYGELLEIKSAYLSSYGNYQYAMIPMKCSYENFNLQVTFDGNRNIVGFTYTEYAEKDITADKKIPDSVVETDYSFQSDGFLITGTFTKPIEGTNLPVVIFVHGSGPCDRDESIFENKPFRDIAWALAEQGIASYRYEKRTYLYAHEVLEDTTFTIYQESINDAVAAADMVSGLDNINPSKVYMLGHSLGGYIMPRISELQQQAAGYIIMAAPAEHIKEYVVEQYKYLAQDDMVVSTEEQQQINNMIEQVKLLDNPEDISANELILGAYKDYWVDLSQYDAVKSAKNMDAPVLLLQGERDYQVTMEQYELWKKAFATKDNWTLKSYPNLNHLMMSGEGKPSPSEYKIKSNVDPLLIQDIIDFIKQ